MELSDVEFRIEEPLEDEEDVLRCLRNLILTPAGTCPLARDFGIDNSFLGLPIETAQSVLAVEIMDKVLKYESRVSVKEVSLQASTDGKIIARVVITSG